MNRYEWLETTLFFLVLLAMVKPKVIAAHTKVRQFGFLGEPRVNVLELNLALDGRDR